MILSLQASPCTCFKLRLAHLLSAGSGDKPPVEWENSKHTSMLGCMCPTFHSVLTMANSSKLQMPLRQSAVLALCWRVTDAVGERLQGRSNRCEIRRFIYKE